MTEVAYTVHIIPYLASTTKEGAFTEEAAAV